MQVWLSIIPHDMQAFYRMHKVKRFPTGPHTPWLNRAEMSVRLFKKFLSTGGYSLHKSGSDHSVTDHTCTVDAQSRDGENTQVILSGKNAYGVSHGNETKRSHGPSFHGSRGADIHTKQDHLNEEIQKLATKTHLEVQQRENIRRDAFVVFLLFRLLQMVEVVLYCFGRFGLFHVNDVVRTCHD